MDNLHHMGAFWIIGIVINVGLTIAALVWVLRQMKPRLKDKDPD
jgi:hypothetical protein